eukprot:g8056.t1
MVARARAAYALLVLALFASASGARKPKADLAPDARLRVGVKFRPEVCERKSRKGDELTLHYEGSLRKTGLLFDSSRARDAPFRFTLGAAQVIKGWDTGLLAMCAGERRRLTIPSGLAYGAQGSPPQIPAGATLVFDVELLTIG